MAGFYPPPPVFVGGTQPYEGSVHVTPSYVPDDPPKRGPLDKSTLFLVRDQWNPGPPLPQMWRAKVTASYVPDNPPRKARFDAITLVIRQSWEPGPPLPTRGVRWRTPSGGDIPVVGPISPENMALLRQSWEPGPPLPQPRPFRGYTPSGGDRPVRGPIFPSLRAVVRQTWDFPFQVPPRAPFAVQQEPQQVPVGPIEWSTLQTILVAWQPPFQMPPAKVNLTESGPPDVIVIPPVPDFGLPPGGGGKRERQRRIIVEIDGEEFTVRSEAEAQALLLQVRALAKNQAEVAAKTALNRARKLRRKTGGLRLPTLEVAIPEIRVLTPQANPDIAAMFVAAQQAIDEIYLRSAQALEMAYLARREYEISVDDDEVMDILLRGE